MDIRHSWPKFLTLAVGLFFVPLSSAEMIPFMFVGVVACLLLHHSVPGRHSINFDRVDIAVITTNLVLTGLAAAWFVRAMGDSITAVSSLRAIDPRELLCIPMWALSQEVLFYYVHRFAHTKAVYHSCHKMHHKYRITDAWASFVSHPADHAVSVLGTAFLLPVLQVRVFGGTFSAPTITTFLFGAIVTFVASHHVMVDTAGDPFGTPHLEHHLLSRKNFANFGIVDKVYNTWVNAGTTSKGVAARRRNKKRRASSAASSSSLMADAAIAAGGEAMERFADD